MSVNDKQNENFKTPEFDNQSENIYNVQKQNADFDSGVKYNSVSFNDYPQFSLPNTATIVEDAKKPLCISGIIALALAIIGVTFFAIPWINVGNLMNKWGLFTNLITLEQNMSLIVGMLFSAFFVFLASAILGITALKKESKTAMAAIFISGLLIIPSLCFALIFAFTKSLTDILF